MALRIFERTLASVRADLRSLYVADAEHGFRLDLADLDEHIGGLKRALVAVHTGYDSLGRGWEMFPCSG